MVALDTIILICLATTGITLIALQIREDLHERKRKHKTPTDDQIQQLAQLYATLEPAAQKRYGPTSSTITSAGWKPSQIQISTSRGPRRALPSQPISLHVASRLPRTDAHGEYDAPIHGYRQFIAILDTHTNTYQPYLLSPFYNNIINTQITQLNTEILEEESIKPGINTAVCKMNPDPGTGILMNWVHPPDEPCPAEACSCGYYANKNPEDVKNYLTSDIKGMGARFENTPKSPQQFVAVRVGAEVEIWGRVIQHRLGWRAQHLRVNAIVKPKEDSYLNMEPITSHYNIPTITSF